MPAGRCPRRPAYRQHLRPLLPCLPTLFFPPLLPWRRSGFFCLPFHISIPSPKMDETNVMGPLSHSTTTPPEMGRDPPIANSENSIPLKEEGDGVLGKRPRKSSLTSSAQHPIATKKPKVEDPVAKAERRRILEEKKRLLADVEQELARISHTKSPSPSIGSAAAAAIPPKHSISAPSTPLPAGATPAPPAGRGVVPPSLTPSATRGKRKSPSSNNIPRRASHDVSVAPTSPTEQGPVTRAKRARRPKRLDTFGGPASLSWALRQCQALLRLLMTHNFGWPFNQPVDPIALNIPDYFDVIKNPMDLGTIKEQLDAGYYETEDEFAEDVRLVWSNTFTYNQPGSDICVMASTLSNVFNEKFGILKAKIEERGRGGGTPEGMEQTIKELRDSMTSVQRELERIKKPSNGRASGPGGRAAREEDARPMTFEEKKKLSHAINNLPSENLGMVVKIIHERMPQLTASGEEIEIDIDALNPATLRHLERYVRSVTQRAGRRRGSRTPSLSGSSSSTSTSSSSTSSSASTSSSSSSGKHVQNESHAPLGTQQKIEDVERQIKALTEHQQALTQKGLARSSGAETDLLMAAAEEKKKKRNDDESESSESESDGSDSESSDSETSDSESDSGSDSESTDTEAGEKKEDPNAAPATAVSSTTTTAAASAETPAGAGSAASAEAPIAGNNPAAAVVEEAAASATSPATAPSTLAEGGGHHENGHKTGSAISFGFDPTLGTKETILPGGGGGGGGGAEDVNGDESLQQGAAVAADDAPPKAEAPKEVALKNVDAWSELSDDFEARTEKPQSPPSLDKTWSQFQTKKMQDAMREKERLEKEERERRERERREEERRYEEERRKREMEQAEERRQREIEEAELSAQRERERQRQAERLAREKGTLSMMEQSMLMASFEQQAPAVPLFQYKQLDDEEADFADLAGDARGPDGSHHSLDAGEEGSEMELSPTAPLPVPASDELEEGQI